VRRGGLGLRGGGFDGVGVGEFRGDGGGECGLSAMYAF